MNDREILLALKHVHDMLHSISGQLTDALNRLTRMEKQIMALADDLKAGLKKLDDETTAIGVLITKLAGEIKNGMTDAEVSEVKASLGTLSDRLSSLAVDPSTPVPPPTPEFAALKKKK